MKGVMLYYQGIQTLCEWGSNHVPTPCVLCLWCRLGVEIVIPEERLLTHNKLADVLPVQLASLFVDESHCDPPLNSLRQRWQKLLIRVDTARAQLSPLNVVWLVLRKAYDVGRNCGALQYLVQEVGAMAGQSSAVIHYSWDVPVGEGRSHSAWTLQTTQTWYSLVFWQVAFEWCT